MICASGEGADGDCCADEMGGNMDEVRQSISVHGNMENEV